ncbi:MAG: hypothetical protein HY282_15700 [Nitrospirae bacterium]|nr:hypothetical protein [Candidatus Manganitrophaceae bacterium]
MAFPMRGKFAALGAFNVYLLCILVAFYQSLPQTFHLDLLAPPSPSVLRLEGPQWDYRSFSFLLLSLMATAFAATLAGALAKRPGGVVAAQGAIPLTLWWTEMFFVSLFTGPLGSGAVCLAAIPLTILIAAYGGKFGERVQRAYFPETTVFGIDPRHLFWILFPFFIYAEMIASWLPYFAEALSYHWLGGGYAETMLHLLSLLYIVLPFLTLIPLLYVVYQILTGTLFQIRSEWGRAALSIGLLFAVPVLLYWILLAIG